jgi:Asp-tRNA(Asn)/Glu-tRNA(Gln) amidotransferase A subunit family amidase
MRGAHPRAQSLDVGGPMARSARDCALLLKRDGRPRSGVPLFDRRARRGLRSIDRRRNRRPAHSGIIEDFTYCDVDADVAAAVRQAAEILAAQGARIETVRLRCWPTRGLHQALLDVLFYEFNQILGDQYRADPRAKKPTVRS